MSNPAEIGHYIALVTEHDPSDIAKQWFAIVSRALPSGVRTTVQVVNEYRENVAMVIRKTKCFHTIIPLTRDLSDAEVESVMACLRFEFDYDVSASNGGPAVAQIDDADVKNTDLVNLCTAWAKRDHEHWMSQKSEQGWSYGLSVSTVSKTHPLMRPWEELPDEYRNIDVDRPQAMLDLLNDQGFAVVKKSEIEAMIRLLRRN